MNEELKAHAVDLVALLKQGAQISRDRNLNLDYAKVTDQAATEIDRLTREAVAADIRIANDAAVIAGLTAERDALARCKLADQDAYVAMRDQRDAAQADAKRLEWLSQQGVSFGFQDIYEGNKWEIGGPYATLRIAIDAEMKGEQS